MLLSVPGFPGSGHPLSGDSAGWWPFVPGLHGAGVNCGSCQIDGASLHSLFAESFCQEWTLGFIFSASVEVITCFLSLLIWGCVLLTSYC